MESFPNLEKKTVLEMLKANGFDHPETKELVMKWIEQREREVEIENTSRAAIVFNIERTDLYIAMGDREGAIQNLEDALGQADSEDEKELQEEIIAKIKEIK